MPPDDAALLDQCFQLDTNVYVPPAGAPHAGDGLNEWHHGAADGQPGPVFVLKSSKRIQDEGIDWWPAFERLQVALRAAGRAVWPDWAQVLRDPRSQAYLKKFFISVTEEEFSRGLLWLDGETQKQQTLVFRRAFANLADHAADPDAKKFIDVQPEGGVDEEAQRLLQEQLEMVPPDVTHIEYAALAWKPGGVDPAEPEHRAYLCTFLDDFTRQMMDALKAGTQKLAVAPDAVVDEACQHLRFALVREENFRSTTSTDEVEAAARGYLKPSDGGSSGGSSGAQSTAALVIYGRSGAGKTYLLSKVMAEHLSSRAAGGVTVIRFLGTTPLSSNVHALLTSKPQIPLPVDDARSEHARDLLTHILSLV